LRKALAAAPPGARKVWSDTTPLARRDWIHWIVSAKQAETRARRIRTACDMLAKGKRRPCCFDRAGMYDKSLRCPVAADTKCKATAFRSKPRRPRERTAVEPGAGWPGPANRQARQRSHAKLRR